MVDYSYNRWWTRKRAEEKRRREIWEAQQKLDEEIQRWMTLKEDAEEFCWPRFQKNASGEDFIQLRGGETIFTFGGLLMYYEDAVAFLKKHIPNLEYDPRINWDCDYEHDPTFSVFK
ncbi:MAG: hypothetical protein AAF697_03545 [Pseudomonadota bacterium]